MTTGWQHLLYAKKKSIWMSQCLFSVLLCSYCFVAFLTFQQAGRADEPDDMLRIGRGYRQVRREEVKSALQGLWTACQADCTCTGTPRVNRSSQASQDENCPYCVATEQSVEVHQTTRNCENTECRVCVLMNQCDMEDAIVTGVNKNLRLSAQLNLSQYMARILNSSELSEERRSTITEALCCLCSCKITKLRNMANVGFLTEFCPRLKFLQLQRGWGDFWCQFSKLGTAIGYHQDRESQVATLVYLRRQCIRDQNSPWVWYLQSDDLPLEERLNRTIFAGCFPPLPVADEPPPAADEPPPAADEGTATP